MSYEITANAVQEFLTKEEDAITKHGIKDCYLKVIKSWKEPEWETMRYVRIGYRGIEIYIDFVITMWVQDGDLQFNSCCMDECSLYTKDGSFCVSSYHITKISATAAHQILEFINKFQSEIKLKSSPIKMPVDSYNNKYSVHI